MFRSRSWFGGNWGRPRNPHSLDHLKYLYSVMSKNPSVTEHNRGLLVESLRCIAEILIWGDQNDSTVFDFFLEKNMLSFFLRIMRQKSGGSSFVCVQLLQTLNILFENIRNETSLYYLLSNNHVNYIIVHKFDFSDEEVMAYYISFLKTLSLKLNGHTIHFFYNEHTNDFPLYTEAIKFFNHPESMVRIAVRTLTLNVYRVEDSSMLTFIRDKTAAPYFSNLVWFIGKHILELDSCVRNDSDHLSQNRLADLVAEHLDHLHYLNDILCLDIPDLNAVLTEHLLHKLFVPLYIYSLTPPPSLTMLNATQHLAEVLNKSLDLENGQNKRVSCIVALFLLSQVFLIITHGPLVHSLAWVILNTDHSVFKNGASEVLRSYVSKQGLVKLGFMQPAESLEKSLRLNDDKNADGEIYDQEASGSQCEADNFSQCNVYPSLDMVSGGSSTSVDASSENLSNPENSTSANDNITDEEKQQRLSITNSPTEVAHVVDAVGSRPFLETIMAALDCSENDYMALFALCLLYALLNNKGLNSELLDIVLCPSRVCGPPRYHGNLMEKLVTIVNLSCQPACRVRLVTLELSLRLLVLLVKGTPDNINGLLGALQGARSQSTALLRNFYRTEEIFLDMFEHEYADMLKRPLNVEWLCMDSAVLLPPTGTPLTGIALDKRLPCGEVERARRAIRVYFLVRATIQKLKGQTETQLPLSNASDCVQVEAVLDLNNSDLIACTVVSKDGSKVRRFLVIDIMQLILVEPDTKRLGFGIAKLVGFLQDIEVTGDKEDPRCLHITIHRTNSSVSTNRVPLLSAKFIFDDHIRSMAAKQKLTKGRIKARAKKMQHIAQLLEIPCQNVPSCSNILSQHSNVRLSASSRNNREHRPLFTTAHRVPGFAAALRRDSLPGSVSRIQLATRQAHVLFGPQESMGSYYSNSVLDGENRSSKSNSRENSPQRGTPNKKDDARSRDSSKNRTGRSRDGSPKIPRPRSEEIPLEEMRLSQSPSTPVQSSSITIQARPQTPKNVENGNPIVENVPKTFKSEETSFIASENGKSKRKGMVETV